MLNLSIREAHISDIDAMAALYQTIHAYHVNLYPEQFLPASQEVLKEDIQRQMQSAAAKFRVAITPTGSELKGYITWKIVEQKESVLMHAQSYLYIDQIIVAESARRFGVARQFLAAVKTFAREEGFSEIRLDYWHRNASAAAFFHSSGFQDLIHRLSISV